MRPAGPARVEALGRGRLLLGVLLLREAEHAIGGEAALDQLERGAARDEQRHDGRGEDHHPAQRQDGQLGRHRDAARVLVEAEEALAPFGVQARGLAARIVLRHA